jgi:hypothetical protein
MSEEGRAGLGMAGRFRLTKCCCCLSLDQGAKVVGAVLLLFSLGKCSKIYKLVWSNKIHQIKNKKFKITISGVYIFYLIKIEDFWDFVLDDLYGIIPCTVPPIDTITDVAFEYSIIANILLVRT